MMLRHYLALAGVLAAGIVLGSLLSPSQPPRPLEPGGSPPATDADPVEPPGTGELRRALERERRARDELIARLNDLQARVEELEIARGAAPVGAAAPAQDTAAASEGGAPVPASRTGVERLVDAGIEPDRARWIQGRLDEIDLQQLYLRDRATREGWINQPRYYEERGKILGAVTDLREEVGDEDYDRMLYALGRPNRVVVRDVMQDSPAMQYGLQAGDRIIEYGGERIFASNEINEAVASGTAGVMTLVRIERDGERQDVYVPRGPLGVRMMNARDRP